MVFLGMAVLCVCVLGGCICYATSICPFMRLLSSQLLLCGCGFLTPAPCGCGFLTPAPCGCGFLTLAPIWAWLPHTCPCVGVTSSHLLLCGRGFLTPAPVWVWLLHFCLHGGSSSPAEGGSAGPDPSVVLPLHLPRCHLESSGSGCSPSLTPGKTVTPFTRDL